MELHNIAQSSRLQPSQNVPNQLSQDDSFGQQSCVLLPVRGLGKSSFVVVAVPVLQCKVPILLAVSRQPTKGKKCKIFAQDDIAEEQIKPR